MHFTSCPTTPLPWPASGGNSMSTSRLSVEVCSGDAHQGHHHVGALCGQAEYEAQGLDRRTGCEKVSRLVGPSLPGTHRRPRISRFSVSPSLLRTHLVPLFLFSPDGARGASRQTPLDLKQSSSQTLPRRTSSLCKGSPLYPSMTTFSLHACSSAVTAVSMASRTGGGSSLAHVSPSRWA